MGQVLTQGWAVEAAQWDAGHPAGHPTLMPGVPEKRVTAKVTKQMASTSDREERLPGGGDCSQRAAFRISSGMGLSPGLCGDDLCFLLPV